MVVAEKNAFKNNFFTKNFPLFYVLSLSVKAHKNSKYGCSGMIKKILDLLFQTRTLNFFGSPYCRHFLLNRVETPELFDGLIYLTCGLLLVMIFVIYCLESRLIPWLANIPITKSILHKGEITHNRQLHRQQTLMRS